jgi:hypothetical protein
MRKAIIVLSMAVAALVGTVLPITPAMAAGALACNVSPGNGIFSQGSCENGTPAFSYTITWEVQGVTGARYSWTAPGATVAGCTSTSSVCAVSVGHVAGARTATVVVTKGSTHTTLKESADFELVCSDGGMPVFC